MTRKTVNKQTVPPTNQDSPRFRCYQLGYSAWPDQGLPGFIIITRKYWVFQPAKSFDDFLDIHSNWRWWRKLRTILRPSRLTLILSLVGMAERPTEGRALLGLTFGCLISETIFQNSSPPTDIVLRFCESATNLSQLEQLARNPQCNISKIFCDNGNNITEMQPNVFLDHKQETSWDPVRCLKRSPAWTYLPGQKRAKAYRWTFPLNWLVTLPHRFARDRGTGGKYRGHKRIPGDWLDPNLDVMLSTRSG